MGPPPGMGYMGEAPPGIASSAMVASGGAAAGALLGAGVAAPTEAAAAPAAAPVVDTAALFLRPGRLGRPERIAVILRGLPGSGEPAEYCYICLIKVIL